MYVQKVAQQGGGHIFGNLCMYGPPFYGPAKKKGGHFYTTLKFFREYLKYGFVFEEEKKNLLESKN